MSVESLSVKDFKTILLIYNYKSKQFGSLDNCFLNEVQSQ